MFKKLTRSKHLQKPYSFSDTIKQFCRLFSIPIPTNIAQNLSSILYGWVAHCTLRRYIFKNPYIFYYPDRVQSQLVRIIDALYFVQYQCYTITQKIYTWIKFQHTFKYFQYICVTYKFPVVKCFGLWFKNLLFCSVP